MHPNKGLTIDLAAVRRLHPAKSLSKFRCIAGNTSRPSNNHSDLFILIDGSLRFERRHFTQADGPFQVGVPLSDTDRFLTLATTDGGDGTSLDWVLLGDPAIDVERK